MDDGPRRITMIPFPLHHPVQETGPGAVGMSQETEKTFVRPYSVLGGFLSYLIPGLGQISQGRIGKGLLFMVGLLGLFHVGEAMGNWQNVYLPIDDNPDFNQ